MTTIPRVVTLSYALSNDSFVTVETVEGDVFVGTLVAVSFEEVKIVSGVRGKPAIVHMNDIETITLADDSNPHIEEVKPTIPWGMMRLRKPPRRYWSEADDAAARGLNNPPVTTCGTDGV